MKYRAGFTTLEVLAAAAVVGVGLTTVTPLAVRHARLLSESRRERIAIEELANQAERLAAMPLRDRQAALQSPGPSAFARARLPDPVLVVERTTSPLGERIVLSLSWDAVGRREHPVTLALWPSSWEAAP